MAAVNDARDGHILNALVNSALSDHFLNDFFAPGHITTPRENSHDTVALAMHDWANRAGTCFEIDAEHWSELDRLLRFFEQGNYQILDAEIDDYKLADRNLTMCGNTADFKLEGLSQEQIKQSIIGNLTDSHDRIFLQGDGGLIRNPKQKLFMLLVQVQSISEVIGSYIDCSVTPACQNHAASTTSYSWVGSYDDDEDAVRPPEAKIRYGNYRIEYDEHDETNETVYFLLNRPKYAYPAVADNAFLLSFGGQTLSHEPARFEAQLELFPMKIGSAFERMRNAMIQRPSSKCKVLRWCNIGFAYGITHSHDDAFRFSGGQFRAIKAFPKISGQFSLYMRRGKYKGENEEAWRNAYGIRYDHGFSLHSFFIGYQWDHGFESNGKFGRENMVSFGWTLTFPSSRFLAFLGGYK
ncbi:MAG: hypothetical protein QGI68_01175 [Pseudomonadales bacterium]|nr:hypothetical protein [Pseudomonadales bacterium]MDP7594168.1 hypothetical protein [Pseudomonadales bacterium]